ncbi:MAG: single-stranded DNA-binding protein [Candidatus Saganbacteria bacterium]|nr:single-stranded DNA-binding protein [Candidatus Saganbacteria bacterium]
MANLNRIILVGQLTTEPETRSTVDGVPMAKFRLAVARPQNGADLIDVIAWRKAAEDCGSKIAKGKMVLVEGRIQNRSFEDQAGQRRWVTEVVAHTVMPFDRAGGKAPAASAAAETSLDDIDLASDLPF